jgi:hypothetical protein
MSAAAVTILVVVIVLVAAALLGVWLMRSRRRRLRARFGPEYDRMMAETDNRRLVEHELSEREKRHAELPIRPLPADARDRYTREWTAVQERFVDVPVEAVSQADRLLTAVMAERGYPTEGYEQQAADLSVRHAGTLSEYRAAHEVSERAAAGTASTEDLRQAMVHYRAVFEELVQEQVRPNGRRPGGQADADRSEPDAADHPGQIDQPDQAERRDRADWRDRAGQPDQTERRDQADGRGEEYRRDPADQPDQAERRDRADWRDRAGQPDQTERRDQADGRGEEYRRDPADQPVQADRRDQRDRPGTA